MEELVKVIQRGNRQVVNSRDLHEFLGNKQKFADWIKNRIENYDFIENHDYEIIGYDYKGNLLIDRLHNLMNSDNQIVSKIDYIITMDMAKELSMVEGNEKGKIARRYFIERDQKLKQLEQLEQKQLPSNYIQALEQLLYSEKEKEKLALENEQMKPKADFFDTVTGSKDTFEMAGVAKILNLGFGRTIMFQKLREKNVLRTNNEPYQQYVDNGWFRCIESSYNKPNGDVCMYKKTVVFQKGVDGIRKLLTKN